jgi:hypothetical protein
VTRLDKLEGEELSSQSSEAKRTPSGDPSGAQQGKHPQEASAPTPTTLLDDTGSRAKDTRAAAGPDHDRDAKLLGYLQGGCPDRRGSSVAVPVLIRRRHPPCSV